MNTHASDQNKQVAFDFAQFMLRPDQQVELISGQEHTITPVNIKTVVDQRLLPVIHTFAETVKTAVSFPISEKYYLDRLRFYGDQLYTQVLQGELTPTKGVKAFIDHIEDPSQDEDITVSTSAASDEVQEVVLVDVNPNLNDLLALFKIQFETIKRPIILLQLFRLVF